MVFSGMFEEPRRPRPRFTLKDKQPLYKYQNGKCNGCKRKYEIKDLAVDHIRAFAKGGSDKTGNTQLLCTDCNSTKGKGTMKQLEKKLIAKGTIRTRVKTKAKAASKTKKGVATKKRTRRTRDPFDDLFGF